MPTTGAVNGSLVVLQVRTATGPDVYVTVGGQRGLKLPRNRKSIGTSAKGDDDATSMPGRRDGTIAMDAMIVAGDVGRLALVAAFEGAGVARVRRAAVGTEAARQCDVVIVKCDETYPDEAESTWSVDLELNGAWGPISP